MAVMATTWLQYNIPIDATTWLQCNMAITIAKKRLENNIAIITATTWLFCPTIANTLKPKKANGTIKWYMIMTHWKNSYILSCADVSGMQQL